MRESSFKEIIFLSGVLVSGLALLLIFRSKQILKSPDYIRTSILISDKTSGWKTYTNTVYGYTLKYPPDYTITHGCSNCTDISKVPSYIEFEPPTQNSYGKITVNGESDKLDSETTEEYFNKESGISTGNITPLSRKTSIIGMFTAYSIITSDHDTNNQQEFVYLVFGNKGFSLEFTPAYLSTSKNLKISDYKNIDIFNQILSTFKFTK